MKKRNIFQVVLCIITLVILVVMICSCQSEETTSADITTTNTSGNASTPPDYFMLHFDSYQDFSASLSEEKTEALMQQATEKQKAALNTLFSQMAQKGTPPIPKLNGVNMPQHNLEGFSNIIVFSEEAHGLPWIMYHCMYKEKAFIIKVTYQSLLGDDATKANGDITKLLPIIWPNGANIDNYETFEGYFKSIVHGKITIGEETIPCVMYDCADPAIRDRFEFLYGDYYVMVDGDFSVLDTDFFSSFSIG